MLYGLGINGLNKYKIKEVILKNKCKGVLDVRLGKYKIFKEDFKRWGINYVDGTNLAKELAPTWDLLKKYREGKIDDEMYTEIFYKKLINNKDKIKKILKEHDGWVLLCYEKRNEFCHRKIIGKFYKKEMGGQYKEITPKT